MSGGTGNEQARRHRSLQGTHTRTENDYRAMEVHKRGTMLERGSNENLATEQERQEGRKGKWKELQRYGQMGAMAVGTLASGALAGNSTGDPSGAAGIAMAGLGMTIAAAAAGGQMTQQQLCHDQALEQVSPIDDST